MANVLYVDDDRNLCQIVAKAFRAEGYTVRTAFDGDQAVASIREDPPDLVMLDLLLPRRDGFEVLEEIRALDEPLCDLPAVLVTGCSPTPAYAQRANALHALDLLAKPVPLERLLEVVATYAGEAKRAAPVEPERPKSARARERAAGGSFDRIPFPALLHHLHGMRATGLLHLESGKKRKWVQLRDGYPVAVRSNLVRETLGHHLVRSGRISRAVLAESRRHMSEKKGRQGEVLVAMEVLREEDVAAALREQADEKLFEVFSWTEGSFRFERSGELQRANVLGLGRSPANLIVEGVRSRFPIERIDRYLKKQAQRLVAHGESPFYRFQELHVERNEEALLRGLDGTQRLGDFAREDESVRRTVYGLLAAGLLELRGSHEKATGKGARKAARAKASKAPKARPADGAAGTAGEKLEERNPQTTSKDRRQDDPRLLNLARTAEQLRARSHWEILGIEPGANEATVRAAYERTSSEMHPDRYAGAGQAVRDLAAEIFTLVNSAYETLMDPRGRQQYALDRKKEERAKKDRRQVDKALEAETEFRAGEAALVARTYEEAMKHFGRALELYPDEGDHHAHYGWSLYLCHPGEPTIVAEALEHVKRGLKLASHREKPYLFLGRLYKAVGRADIAERMFTRAIQIQPDCLEAMRELRLINMRRQKSKGLIGRLFRR